jgi:hypothetical protein
MGAHAKPQAGKPNLEQQQNLWIFYLPNSL